MEALIGALYLDLGLEQSREYVLVLYQPILHDLQEGVLRRDYKTLLQEFSQARFGVTPSYRIISERGPDHSKEFEAEVILLHLLPDVETAAVRRKQSRQRRKKHGASWPPNNAGPTVIPI